MTEARIPWTPGGYEPEDSEEERGRTLTELFNVDWRETSFVPAGDNPPARITFWKEDSEAGGLLTEEEIEEILADVAIDGLLDGLTEANGGEGEGGSYTVAKLSEVNRAAQKLIEEEPERFQKIQSPAARLAAARSIVNQREFAQAQVRMASEGGSQAEPVAKGEKAFAKIDAAARERYPDLYDRSPSAARTRIVQTRGDHGYHEEVSA